MYRKLVLALLLECCVAGIGFSQSSGQTPIPDRFKGIILSAPLIDPPANYFSPGSAMSRSNGRLQSVGQSLTTQGIYRLKINPQTGAVDEVGIMHRSGVKRYDAAAVMAFFQWKFKPGAIRQLDVPVVFERTIIINLGRAGST